MVSDNFYQGYMQQRAINANAEIRNANILLGELRAQRDSDAKEIESLRSEVKRTKNIWAAHYIALEAERDYLLGLLDKAHGPEENPARKQAYRDEEEFRIPQGPRKGERPTMRDHIFFSKIAEVVKSRFPSLGNWKKLMEKNEIFE